jgi:hypothetical protein
MCSRIKCSQEKDVYLDLEACIRTIGRDPQPFRLVSGATGSHDPWRMARPIPEREESWGE